MGGGWGVEYDIEPYNGWAKKKSGGGGGGGWIVAAFSKNTASRKNRNKNTKCGGWPDNTEEGRRQDSRTIINTLGGGTTGAVLRLKKKTRGSGQQGGPNLKTSIQNNVKEVNGVKSCEKCRTVGSTLDEMLELGKGRGKKSCSFPH